jgi:hypothetical protein
MYPKKSYYPHKIIYLLVLLFKDPMFLVQTLLFVYTLPCFHPYIIGAWSSSKRKKGDGVSQSRFGRWEMRWASKGGGVKEVGVWGQIVVGHQARKAMVWLIKDGMFQVKTSKSINLVVKVCYRPHHIYCCAYFG